MVSVVSFLRLPIFVWPLASASPGVLNRNNYGAVSGNESSLLGSSSQNGFCACSGDFPKGSRVRVDRYDRADGPPVGTLGTVLAGMSSDTNGQPLWVEWHGWTWASYSSSYCYYSDCGTCSNNGESHWWVYCSDVSLAAAAAFCACDGMFIEGSRVRVDRYDRDDGPPVGTLGTVLAGFSDGLGQPLLVEWDSWAWANHRSASCDYPDCGTCGNRGESQWWVDCSDISLAAGPSPSPASWTFLPHHMGPTSDQHGWPTFQSEDELRANNPWTKYFQSVYGTVPTSGYPIGVNTLTHLYRPALASAGVNTPTLSTACPTQDGEYYATMTDHQDSWSSWIFHSELAWPAATSLPSATWVEFIHQAYYMDGGATWMYYAPGMAIWFNLGTTKVYLDHDQAVLDLLNEACQAGEGWAADQHQCIPQFPRLYQAALASGWDSLQFLRHADMVCGAEQTRRNVAIEILDLAGPGIHACGQSASGKTRYRAGWEAQSECICDNNLEDTINCAGFGMHGANLAAEDHEATEVVV